MTAYGMVSRQIQDSESRAKKESANQKKKKISSDAKILRTILPKLRVAVFDALEMKPDKSVEALFTTEVDAHLKV